MAIKVSSTGGLIKIDDGSTNSKYINKNDLVVNFKSDRVILSSNYNEDSSEILFTEFQDNVGGTYTTETTIMNYITSI